MLLKKHNIPYLPWVCLPSLWLWRQKPQTQHRVFSTPYALGDDDIIVTSGLSRQFLAIFGKQHEDYTLQATHKVLRALKNNTALPIRPLASYLTCTNYFVSGLRHTCMVNLRYRYIYIFKTMYVYFRLVCYNLPFQIFKELVVPIKPAATCLIPAHAQRTRSNSSVILTSAWIWIWSTFRNKSQKARIRFVVGHRSLTNLFLRWPMFFQVTRSHDRSFWWSVSQPNEPLRLFLPPPSFSHSLYVSPYNCNPNTLLSATVTPTANIKIDNGAKSDTSFGVERAQETKSRPAFCSFGSVFVCYSEDLSYPVHGCNTVNKSSLNPMRPTTNCSIKWFQRYKLLSESD